MKNKLLLLPLAIIFFISFASAASVTVSTFYDATPSSALTIMNGDSVGVIISADSLFESYMDVKLELINSANVVTSLISVHIEDSNSVYCYDLSGGTRACSYYNHVTIPSASLPVGSYTIRGAITGASGQADTSTLSLQVLPVTSGNHVPVIISTPVAQVNEGVAYSYDVDATDADGDAIVYSLTQAPSWIVINANTGMITGTAPQVTSDYEFIATVKASDGKDFDTQTFTITVKNVIAPPVNHAPAVTSMPSMSVNEGTAYTYNVIATDADGNTLTYALAVAPSWLSINSATGVVSGTAPLVSANTNFPITVRVSDGVGGIETQAYTLTVVDVVVPPVNHLPVLTSTPVTSVNEGTAYSYDVNANDADGNTLAYSLPQKPVWLSINSATGVISGTAPLVNANTNFLVNIVVSDGIGFVTQDYTLTVVDVIVPPVNTAPVANNQNVATNMNTSVGITLTATDAEGNTLTYSIVANPAHGTISGFNSATGALAYTPHTNHVGADSFTFKVNDGTVNSNVATVSITVNPIVPGNNDPVITSTIAVTSVNEGAMYNYDVNATDADGNTLTYSLTVAPAWLSINSVTGLISGTAPLVNADTNFPITVRVSDGVGGITTQSYTLTVINIPAGGGSSGGHGVRVVNLDNDFENQQYLNQFAHAKPIILEEESAAQKQGWSWLKILFFWLFVLVLILAIWIIIVLLTK